MKKKRKYRKRARAFFSFAWNSMTIAFKKLPISYWLTRRKEGLVRNFSSSSSLVLAFEHCTKKSRWVAKFLWFSPFFNPLRGLKWSWVNLWQFWGLDLGMNWNQVSNFNGFLVPWVGIIFAMNFYHTEALQEQSAKNSWQKLKNANKKPIKPGLF